jgi:hypothetical protein
MSVSSASDSTVTQVGDHSTSNEIISIKEEWAAREMTAREAQFTAFEDKLVFVGTWNVNGQKPTEYLTTWLTSITDPHMYVIGFQELDLSPESFVLVDSAKEEERCELIEKALAQQNAEYIKLCSRQLVGMLVVVYVQLQHYHEIKDVSTSALGTGIMGMVRYMCWLANGVGQQGSGGRSIPIPRLGAVFCELPPSCGRYPSGEAPPRLYGNLPPTRLFARTSTARQHHVFCGVGHGCSSHCLCGRLQCRDTSHLQRVRL